MFTFIVNIIWEIVFAPFEIEGLLNDQLPAANGLVYEEDENCKGLKISNVLFAVIIIWSNV